MNSVKIIAGNFKGRAIPFANTRFNDADITPQKVKEALFAIIGDGLNRKAFLDLYGGSGQIGFEALSRGASPVVINEYDRKRFFFIKDFARGLDAEGDVDVLNFYSFRALKYLSKKGRFFDLIFIDRPYFKIKGEAPEYENILLEIEKSRVLNNDGSVIIQHFSGNLIKENIGSYAVKDMRKYGSSSLSFYVTTDKALNGAI